MRRKEIPYVVLRNKALEETACRQQDVEYMDKEWELTDTKLHWLAPSSLGEVIDNEFENANRHSFVGVGMRLADILVENVGMDAASMILADILKQDLFDS